MTDFYSDIKMGNWEMPVHIGCYHFNWSLYIDIYDYHKQTEYGCEIKDKYWLAILDNNRAIFYNTYGTNEGFLNYSQGVAKTQCMELYKKWRATSISIVGKPQDKFWTVYQSFNADERSLLSFADFDEAAKYRDMMIRIPFSRYHTSDSIKIKQILC